MPHRPRYHRRWLRAALVTVAAVVGVAVVAAAIFVATFNADSFKPRVIAAVQAATGRTLALNGPIGLKFSLHPTIEVSDAALANPAGFSRPDMARVRAIDLELDLVPLLHRRIAIRRLVLVDPDVLLERAAQGETNWRFTPAAPTAAPHALPGTPAQRLAFAFNEIQVENGHFAYRDDRTGHVAAIAVRRLDAAAPSDAPMHMTADASVNGLAFTATLDTGSLDVLQAPGAAPWPVKVTVDAAGATLRIGGTIARPLEGSGYRLALDGSIPDLAALARFAPNARLPPLHQVAFSAQVADTGGRVPQISALSLRAGASDLSAVFAGLKLEKLDLAAPALDQPVHAEVAGSYDGASVSLAASLGAPAKLLGGQPGGPFPVDVAATVAGASLEVKGSIADPVRLIGLDLDTNAHVPDLAALSPLARRPLPPIKNISFQGRLDAPDGLAKGLELHAAKLSSAPADLAGDASFGFGRPPSLTARLRSDRLDLDALRAAFRPSAAAAPPPAHAAPPTASPQAAAHVIPDTRLPFDRLHGLNADAQLAVSALTTGGETWRDVSGHLVLQDGKLQLAPFKAMLPAGALDVALSVDATRPQPAVALRLNAPAVAVGPLLALAGQRPFARGSVAITADVHGVGDTPHAIAASLNGTMGATMSGGEIETPVLEQALGPVVARANPVGVLAHGGASEIRCFTAKLDAHNGVATLNPFLLSSSLITLAGSGTLNLGAETLDLHLQSQGRIGGTGFAVPLTVGGGFRDPHVALNQTGAASKGIEVVIGALTGNGNPLASLAGNAPSCAAALGEVRGGAPAAAPVPSPAPKAKLPNAGALLRQLLR